MNRQDSKRLRARASRAARHFGAAIAGTGLLLLGGSPGMAQDIRKGEAAFVRQCAVCHTIERDGPNRYGPNLFGIVGKKAGAAPGFGYSRAFRAAANWVWDEGLLRPWISLPGTMVPGTAMGIFQGVADRDADDIVAYLAAQK